MAKRLRIHRGATVDIEEARDSYARAGEDLATDLLAEIDAAIAGVSEAPQRWPPYRARTRRRLVKRFPFSVIYLDRDDEIAVAHHSRRPGYWTKRLRE